MEDMLKTLKLVSARIDAILATPHQISPEGRMSLQNLSHYTGTTLARVVGAGRQLQASDIELVHKLDAALHIINLDSRIELKEVETLIKIAEDLNITDTELQELSGG